MSTPTPPTPPPPEGRGPAQWFNYTSAASVGIEIVVVFLMFTFGGYWLERNVTYWSPWTAMIGMMFGIFASGMVVARLVREHNAAMAEKARVEAATSGTAQPSDTEAASDRPGEPHNTDSP